MQKQEFRLPCCRRGFVLLEELECSERAYLEYKNFPVSLSGYNVLSLKKTISAMLNSLGGVVLLGVEEAPNKQRRVRGVDLCSERLLGQFAAALREGFEPPLREELQVAALPVLRSPGGRSPVRHVVRVALRPLRPLLYAFRLEGELFVFKREESESRRIISPAELYD
jgi:hypothetical protein